MPSSAVARVRKPRNQYHHGDLRRALVQEAVRTIASQGIEHLTLREAGARLGVSRTALYRHFSDKSALLAAVARDGFQRFRADLEAAWAKAPGTREGFTLMGAAYVHFAVSHPGHYRVMFGDFLAHCEKDPDLQGDAQSAFVTLIRALVELQRAGLVRHDDPQQLGEFIWSTVHGTAMLAVNGQLGPDPAATSRLDDVVRFALDHIWSGIDSGRARGRR